MAAKRPLSKDLLKNDFAALYKHVATGVCVISKQHLIEFSNEAFDTLFGYTEPKLKGCHIDSLLPTFSQACGKCCLDREEPDVKKFSSKSPLNLWAIKKGGQQFLVRTHCRPYPLNYKNSLIIFVVGVTERGISDDTFKVIFYKSPVSKALSEFETGKIVEANNGYCKLFGYERHELIGKSPVELGIINAENRKMHIESIRKGKQLVNNEMEFVAKNKQSVFALVSTEQIEIEGRKLLLSTLLDVTERRKITQELQRAKDNLEKEAEDLKRLVDAGNRLWKKDTIQDGLKQILDSSLALTNTSKGDIQIYDFRKKILEIKESRGFSEKFLTHFREVTAEEFSTCGIALKKRAQFVTEDTELEWDKEDATIAQHNHFRSCQSTPLLYRDGSPMGMISTHFENAGKPSASVLQKMKLYGLVAESFLERMQTYEMIQKQNIFLEEKVAIRTRELFAALEHEKAVNDMKSRFISMASHEFRTPLARILFSTTLIKGYRQENQGEKRAWHLKNIEDSVGLLVEILNDFLSLDKLEQGKVEVAFQQVNFKNLVQDVMAELNCFLKKEQHMALSYEGTTVLSLDPKILCIVLRNLFSNAIKYSGAETAINIAVKVTDKIISINVTDQGIGISEEEQAKLFSTFFRANNASNIQGTGLGLSIVKKYVGLMNGTIDFTSRLNEGTTFRVIIPRSKS